MNRFTAILLLAALPLFAGCAQKTAENATPGTDTTAKAPAASTVAATSAYDAGARANATPADAAKAELGEKLFATKGCTACHAIGKKLTGPDLKGVTERRTALWMQHQIMEPDVMTKTDPISHQLMVDNKNLQMLNLHLTQDEAMNLIEYFKKTDAAK